MSVTSNANVVDVVVAINTDFGADGDRRDAFLTDPGGWLALYGYGCDDGVAAKAIEVVQGSWSK